MPSIIQQGNNIAGIEIDLFGSNYQVPFKPYQLESKRSPYELELTHGLDENGNTSTHFVGFDENSLESTLISFVETANVQLLLDRGLVLFDRPQLGDISRNVAVYDPKTNNSYFIGGIGLIKSVGENPTKFCLLDPNLDRRYGEFHREQEKIDGGFRQFSDEGVQDVDNQNHLGVILYEQGPRPLVRKIRQTIEKDSKGLSTPQYIAAGKIKNIGDGQFGFAIYRSQLTPDYTASIPLFMNNQGSFTQVYGAYLDSKYAQLARLHNEIQEIHAEYTNTNTPIELRETQGSFEVLCQVKDWDTNHPLPENVTPSIEDGVCQVSVGLTVIKSPRAAALVYDLQLAITQELNIIIFPMMRMPAEVAIKYMQTQLSQIVPKILGAYGLQKSREETQPVLQFLSKYLGVALNQGLPLHQFNIAAGGLIAHAMLIYSPTFQGQIKLQGT